MVPHLHGGSKVILESTAEYISAPLITLFKLIFCRNHLHPGKQLSEPESPGEKDPITPPKKENHNKKAMNGCWSMPVAIGSHGMFNEIAVALISFALLISVIMLGSVPAFTSDYRCRVDVSHVYLPGTNRSAVQFVYPHMLKIDSLLKDMESKGAYKCEIGRGRKWDLKEGLCLDASIPLSPDKVPEISNMTVKEGNEEIVISFTVTAPEFQRIIVASKFTHRVKNITMCGRSIPPQVDSTSAGQIYYKALRGAFPAPPCNVRMVLDGNSNEGGREFLIAVENSQITEDLKRALELMPDWSTPWGSASIPAPLSVQFPITF